VPDFPYKGVKMKRVLIVLLVAVLGVTTAGVGSSYAGASFGAGIHYLRNLGDIDESGIDLDKNSIGIVGSILARAAFLNLEGQVEYITDYAGTDEGMWIPQGWALIGSMIYAGAGIGIANFDGEWQDDPFYGLRAGVNIPLGSLGLDTYATYLFWNDDAFEDVTGEDLDSITFAALLRFNLGGDN
jgi:hypothetical protein